LPPVAAKEPGESSLKRALAVRWWVSSIIAVTAPIGLRPSIGRSRLKSQSRLPDCSQWSSAECSGCIVKSRPNVPKRATVTVPSATLPPRTKVLRAPTGTRLMVCCCVCVVYCPNNAQLPAGTTAAVVPKDQVPKPQVSQKPSLELKLLSNPSLSASNARIEDCNATSLANRDATSATVG